MAVSGYSVPGKVRRPPVGSWCEHRLSRDQRKALHKAGTIKTPEVDLGVLRELRETERQIAIETGQWEEKTSSKGEVKSISEALRLLPTDVLEREIERLLAIEDKKGTVQ